MRIKWVDYGKGFTILLVIIGHVALGTLESAKFFGNDAFILHLILEMMYAIHIPVFFALSGFFFKPIKQINRIWIRGYKRLLSLGIPYVVFSIIMVGMKFVGGASVRNQDGLTGLLNIYKVPIDYLWFLYALFFVDLFVSVISYFVKSKIWLSFLLVLGFIFETTYPASLPVISYILLWSPFFYLGFLLRDFHVSKRLAIFSFIVYVIHLPIFCVLYPNKEFLWGYWRVISVVCVFMMFYFFEHWHEKDSLFIEWCGVGSIVLYLVHAPVISVTRILLFKIGINSLWLQLIVQFFFGFGLSLIVLWLSERIRLIDFIFRPVKYLLKTQPSR